jgi:hypothetical protein
MQVTGTVIQVALNAPIKKKDGGTYEGWQLVYNTPEGEVKTIAKPIQGLKFNAALKTGLQNLVAGDDFTLEMEKNAAGFWDPKTISKGAAQGAQAPVNVQKAAATPTKSTYETSEERAAKQVYIVRQSSIANAINFLNVSGSKKHTTEEALVIAKQFEDFVFGKEVAAAPVNFDDFENDLPM